MSGRRRAGLAVLAALVCLAGAAWAVEPCAHRGTLDPLYRDEDRDLVADLPKDRARLVSPDPLIFSYVPVEDPAVYETAWADFLTHLEKATGKRVKYFGLMSHRYTHTPANTDSSARAASASRSTRRSSASCGAASA